MHRIPAPSALTCRWSRSLYDKSSIAADVYAIFCYCAMMAAIFPTAGAVRQYDYLNRYYCPASTCVQPASKGPPNGQIGIVGPASSGLLCTSPPTNDTESVSLATLPQAWNPIYDGGLSESDLKCVDTDMGGWMATSCEVPDDFVYPDSVKSPGSEDAFGLARSCECPPNSTALGKSPGTPCGPTIVTGDVTSDAIDDSKDCLMGDIMYGNGENMGYIGLTCLDESNFIAKLSSCMSGEVVETETEMTCPTRVPFCCQSGTPGTWGAATCLSAASSCEAAQEGSGTGFGDRFRAFFDSVIDST